MKQRKFIAILVSTSMAFNVLSATTGSVIFAAEEETDDLIATEETTEEVLKEDQAEVTEATEVQEAEDEKSEDEIIEETVDESSSDEEEYVEGSEELAETVEETTEESEEIIEETPKLPTAFSDEAEAGGFIVSVTADEGVFPSGSYMIVNVVDDAEADALVDDSRNDDVNVAYSMTFDITVYDIDGNEIEPDTAAGNVYVSFTASGIANDNLEVDVYHITDDAAVLLDTDVYEDTVIAETDGFSYYTVEFTYNDLQYVLDGDSTVELSVVLDTVGLHGTVTNAEVSNSYLFSAYEADGVWYVSANNPFTTNEWMKVTVDGIEYVIDVTDAVSQSDHNGYIGYRVATHSPASWSDRGYDIYGLNGTTELQTTWSNGGYCSEMRVNHATTAVMTDSSGNFSYGQVYRCDGVEAYITAAIQGERSVVVTYTMTNTTDNIIELDIGSYADCQIGSNDSAPIDLNSNGIVMSDGTKDFYLIPGSGDFTTCWYGQYDLAKGKVFSGVITSGKLTNTDSGLAFSWNLIIPAGATVTRTAIFSVGANMTSYKLSFDKNSSEAEGTMSDQQIISGITGSISGCRFTRTGYSFVGWAETPTGSVVYTDQQQITLTGNKTLYAVWMPSSAILTDPTVVTGLVYNGNPQTLLQGGGAENGTIQYSIDRVNYSPEYPTGINATSYTIYYKAVGNPGFGDSEVRSITNSIARATSTLTAPTAVSNLTYNGTAQTLVNPGSTNGGRLVYSLSPNGPFYETPVTATAAGPYTVYFKVEADSNVTGTSVSSIQVTMNKANVIVNANDISKTYGNSDPTLTATVSGVGSGMPSVNYTLSRAAGQNVGTYTITVTPGNNPNYNVTTVGGTFTINPRNVTVAANNSTKIYGTNDPNLTANVTGRVNNDTINYTLTREEGEDARTYEIVVTPGTNPNYNVTTTNATFTITRADALISADDLSKIYGEADPELTVTITGAVGDDELDYTIAREEGENAGDYVITVTLGENPNYTVIAEPGTLTIEQKEATVAADDLSKIYGEEDPTLTATVFGAVGEEELNYTIAREEGENAGEYVITVTLGENPNYTIATEDGIFTIEQKEATVTAEDISKIYGGEDPELAATVDGTVGEEVLEYTIAREEGENAGEYVIAITLGDNPNYDITVVDGTFTIAPAQATVIAEDNSKIYGDEDPELVTIVTGTIGDEVLDYTVSREEGEDAGEYVIAITLGENPNYDITVEDATFTIEKADPVVTAPIGVVVDYTGEPQELFIPGTTTGGTLEYSFDGVLYTTGTLKGVADGYYVILYRVAGDNNYNSTDTRYIVAKINTVMVTITFVDPTTGLPIGGTNPGTNGFPSNGTGTTGNDGTGTNGFPFGGIGTTGNGDQDTNGFPFDGIGITGNGGQGTGTTVNGDQDIIGLPFGGTGTTGNGVPVTNGFPFTGSETTSNGSQGYAAAGHALTAPEDPSRYAHDFTGWYVDEDCTIPFDFNDPVGMNGATIYAGWESVDYHLTEGADGSWTADDAEQQQDGLRFRAVRNRLEETTFSHYTYVVVDGQVLGPNDYTARSGSVIIELSPEFLATLDVGEHELNIVFDDADSVITYFMIEGMAEEDKKVEEIADATDAKIADVANAADAVDTEIDVNAASITAARGIINTGEKVNNTNYVIAFIFLCASAVTSGFYIKRTSKEKR